MDLGLQGKWALVCGASKGLGLGCAQALCKRALMCCWWRGARKRWKHLLLN